MSIWLSGVLLLGVGIAILAFVWARLDGLTRLAAGSGILCGAGLLAFGLLAL